MPHDIQPDIEIDLPRRMATATAGSHSVALAKVLGAHEVRLGGYVVRSGLGAAHACEALQFLLCACGVGADDALGVAAEMVVALVPETQPTKPAEVTSFPDRRAERGPVEFDPRELDQPKPADPPATLAEMGMRLLAVEERLGALEAKP